MSGGPSTKDCQRGLSSSSLPVVGRHRARTQPQPSPSESLRWKWLQTSIQQPQQALHTSTQLSFLGATSSAQKDIVGSQPGKPVWQHSQGRGRWRLSSQPVSTGPKRPAGGQSQAWTGLSQLV